MHDHKFDTVIWRAEQQRVTKQAAALSDDQDFSVVQGLVVRRCECGEVETEKYERPADPESRVQA